VREPLVNADFQAPPGWSSGHLQTMRSRLLRLQIPDALLGDEHRYPIDLDDGSGDRLWVSVHTQRPTPQRPQQRPRLVVLVHGLGGSADAYYARATTAGLLAAGYATARLDLRGAGRFGVDSRHLYHAGRTEDLRAALARLAEDPAASDPTSDAASTAKGEPSLALVGFSLGGNLTLKLLGEPMPGLPVRAGVAVSAPLDLAAGADHLHHVLLGAYEQSMLTGLRREVLRDGRELTADQRAAIAQARRIEEFDDAYTARVNGWRDAAEYYAVNSAAQYLPRIQVPTLVVHALDDPVVPSGPYRSVDWSALEAEGPVRRRITRHGGHVGFHERGATVPWYVRQIVDFLGSLGASGT
jgi:hypothetical protein